MINQTFGETKAESVDIKEYIAILLKRKWLVLICFLLSMAGTTAFLFTRQPIYRATAKLLVTRSGNVMPVSEVTQVAGDFISTQINIMRSQTMLRRVQLRMRKSPEEIRENLHKLNITSASAGAIIIISVDSPSADFARDFANALAEEYFRFRDEERAQSSESALLMLTREINRISQEVKAANDRYVQFVKDNQLVGTEQLRAKEHEQLLLMYGQAAMALAEVQTRKQLIESKPDAASALAILAAETRAARAHALSETLPVGRDVASLNLAVDQKSPPARPEASDPQSRTNSDSEVDATFSALLGKQIADTTTAETTAGMPDAALGINRLSLWAITEQRAQRLFELEDQRRSLEARLAEMRAFYKAKHPALIQTEAALETVKKRIDAEVQMVREKTSADMILAQTRYNQIKAALDEMYQRSFRERSKALEFQALQADLERIRGLYNALLGKLMQIDVTQNFSAYNISILEQALVDPDPVYPKKMKGLLVAAFFGLGIGLALAFFLEYIDDSIKLAEEVERDLQLPFLGMIPAAQWNPDDLTAHRLDHLKQQGGVAESYRVVRSAIIFSTPKEKLRSILVTSAVPREGKTTTVVNLGIGFSQVEDRVLVVDGDLRRGEIHKYFNLEKDNGLADLLLGEATPEQVVKHTDVPKLDVVTCGAYPANPAELLLGWRLKEFVQWAHQNYDRVVIDCPPIMGIADSVILGAAVDGVLLVIWAGRTSRRYVRVAKMHAVSRGAKLFGFILNNLEPGRVGYYHYYPYYYSYYSRGYYYAHKEEESGKGGDIKGIEVPSKDSGKDEIQDVY